MKRLRNIVKLSVMLAFLLLCLPAFAFGDVSTGERHGLVLSQVQLYAVVIGALSPLASYVVNAAVVRKVWAHVPEPVAAMVHVLIAAVAAAIYQSAEANSLGLNDATLQVVLTAVAASFAAHGFVWKPSGIQERLAKPPKARRAH